MQKLLSFAVGQKEKKRELAGRSGERTCEGGEGAGPGRISGPSPPSAEREGKGDVTNGGKRALEKAHQTPHRGKPQRCPEPRMSNSARGGSAHQSAHHRAEIIVVS